LTKVNRAKWRAVLCLGLVVVAVGIPAGTAHAGNSVSGSFSVSDDAGPPAAVSLSVTGQSYTSITLSWVAPGDDGNPGIAAEYDIRYYPSVIDTEARWQVATRVPDPPSPKIAGSAESFTVNGLNPGSTYYFAIKTADEVRNWSGLSNSPRGDTLYYHEETLEPSPPSSAGGHSGLLEFNMMGQKESIKIGTDGTFNEALTLTDDSKNFVLYIAAGTKMTGPDGSIPSRVELKIVNESIITPDNILILSPIYELTGYNRNMEAIRIGFEPAARLTIRYDHQKLIRDTFLPFVAYDTPEEGVVRLPLPADSAFTDGEATALTNHASLFFVAAEVTPLPPPLPPAFEANNLVINPRQATAGEPVTISLTITNTGGTAGTYELYLIIDGIVRTVKEVTLAGNSAETLTFEVSNFAVGSHQVRVAGLTERFTVVAEVAVPPAESGFHWLIMDTGVGATLTAGLLALFLVMRRSRRTKTPGPTP
jgi:hypothetical protein